MKELTYKKNLMKDLTAFRNELSGYIKDDYLKLINLCSDCDNTYGEPYLVDYIYEQDFIDEDDVMLYIKENVDDLARLRCYINSTYNDDIYRIDGYGNLDNITQSDMENLCDEVIGILKDNIKQLSQSEL